MTDVVLSDFLEILCVHSFSSQNPQKYIFLFLIIFICFIYFSCLLGLINIPAVALGIFSGGIIMKKFRIGVYGAAKLYLVSAFFGYLLFLSLFALGCENSDVAGLTVSYQGYVHLLNALKIWICLISYSVFKIRL